MKYNELKLTVTPTTPTNLQIAIHHGERLAYLVTLTKEQALQLAHDLLANAQKIEHEPSGSSEIPNNQKCILTSWPARKKS